MNFTLFSKATDATLKLLKTFPDLESLETNDRMTEYGLTHLGDLKKLKVLDLTRSSIDDDGLSRLAGFTHLKVLILAKGTITDKGLARLSNLKELQELDLSYTLVTAEGIKKLRAASPRRPSNTRSRA